MLKGSPFPTTSAPTVLTIDALYRRIDEMQCKADEVRFTSSNGGVPEKVFIDPSREAADEEFEVNISELSPVTPDPVR